MWFLLIPDVDGNPVEGVGDLPGMAEAPSTEYLPGGLVQGLGVTVDGARLGARTRDHTHPTRKRHQVILKGAAVVKVAKEKRRIAGTAGKRRAAGHVTVHQEEQRSKWTQRVAAQPPGTVQLQPDHLQTCTTILQVITLSGTKQYTNNIEGDNKRVCLLLEL